MAWFILGHVVTTLLDRICIGHLSSCEKGLEILLLRQQLTLVQRRLDKPMRTERVEKLTLAILAAKLKSITNRPTKYLVRLSACFNQKRSSNGIATWYAVSGAIGAEPRGQTTHHG